MKFVREPSKETSVIHQTEVLVVGSGPGGLAAALGAARAGSEVTLLERFGCFGGNITAVGVEGFAWYRHEQTVDTEGVGIEFEARARALGAAVKEPQSDSYAIDGEAFKWVADTLVEEAGVTPMLHRLFVSPIMDGDVIKGVIVESKAGRGRFSPALLMPLAMRMRFRAGAITQKQAKEDMIGALSCSRCRGRQNSFIEHVKSTRKPIGIGPTGSGPSKTLQRGAIFRPFCANPLRGP